MIDLTQYRRRATHEVRIGACTIGGTHPVAVQSMTNTDTRDTAACVAQIERIARAGAPIVRLTAQGVREAENLRDITERLRADGNTTALVADIHFLPEAAAVAAQYVDKVRINPGNYRLDRGELEALVARCRERGVALRIGVNHGSLSKRIFDEWGDTPEGMVAAAMEFLHVCRREAFDQVVVSMKSSNTRVMVAAYRLLVEAMEREGMTYPIHLGVTEAGNGLEGRIKSAVGIGALLADGIGDTIRVSLTEAPENEIPVARLLADHFRERPGTFEVKHPERYSPTVYRRRSGVQTPVVRDEITPAFRLLESTSQNPTAELRAAILSLDGDEPAAVVRRYDDTDLTTLAVKAAADLGPLFLDGLADGIRILEYRIHRLPLVRPHALRHRGDAGADQGAHVASEKSQNRRHGLHRQRPRRDGRRRLRLRGRRSRAHHPLQGAHRRRTQHPAGGGARPAHRPDPRKRRLAGTRITASAYMNSRRSQRRTGSSYHFSAA